MLTRFTNIYFWRKLKNERNIYKRIFLYLIVLSFVVIGCEKEKSPLSPESGEEIMDGHYSGEPGLHSILYHEFQEGDGVKISISVEEGKQISRMIFANKMYLIHFYTRKISSRCWEISISETDDYYFGIYNDSDETISYWLKVYVERR